MKTCLYCESTNWSKSNDTCYLYYSYGSGKIDFIASYKDEDSMFDAMNENNSDLDPVRYTFSSLDDLYSKVKDEEQAFYFTLDSYKYDICPECLFKESSPKGELTLSILTNPCLKYGASFCAT